MVRLGGLHLQGLSLSVIAQQTGLDRKTIRRYIERGLEPPAYTPRPACVTRIMAFETYLRERVAAYPELTASRLHRELRDLRFAGGYTTVKVFLRAIRPGESAGFEVRFETPPAARRRSTSPASTPCSPTSPASAASFSCSPCWPQPHAMWPVRAATGHADGPALPRHRVRGPGRRTNRNPPRPH